MASITKILSRYTSIQDLLTKKKKELSDLKKEENELSEQIKLYLVDKGEDTIHLDSNTTISLKDVDKKIMVPPKTYKEKVKSILKDNGIYTTGLENEIIDAKVSCRFQEKKLKLKKV